jgi:hypothetical protein
MQHAYDIDRMGASAKVDGIGESGHQSTSCCPCRNRVVQGRVTDATKRNVDVIEKRCAESDALGFVPPCGRHDIASGLRP